MAVLISAIDLASVAVVAKFNTFEGVELQLRVTRSPSLKQRRLLIFLTISKHNSNYLSVFFFSFEFGWVVNH